MTSTPLGDRFAAAPRTVDGLQEMAELLTATADLVNDAVTACRDADTPAGREVALRVAGQLLDNLKGGAIEAYVLARAIDPETGEADDS